MPLRRRQQTGWGSANLETMTNILNGVLACAWDRTSTTPKLLEIANSTQVRFNIDTFNPLILRFADGWDDHDRPKGIAMQLSAAPQNIDLSAKANCHVQICAKVINDELVITTHDVYDPSWVSWSNIIPQFSSYASVNGWGISVEGAIYATGWEGWRVRDVSESSGWKPNSSGSVIVTSPYPISLARIGIRGGSNGTSWGFSVKKEAVDPWISIGNITGANGWYTNILTDIQTLDAYSYFKIYQSSVTALYELSFNERPTAKFFRSLNKVKDRTDTEVYWINLGYATVDASGNITALTHYTDLRNNYPGGMRVEA